VILGIDEIYCLFVDNISLRITSLRQNLTVAHVLVAVRSCILHLIYTVHILTVAEHAKHQSDLSAAVQHPRELRAPDHEAVCRRPVHRSAPVTYACPAVTTPVS